MAVLTGAMIKVFINEQAYPQAQSVNYSLDYGERPVYGIDSPYPQEIHSSQASVSGSIQGIRLSNTGGIQSINGRPTFKDILLAPYITIRIQDRRSGEDLIFVPQAKIANQNVTVDARGVLRLSFSFTGLIGLEVLDRV